MLRRVVLPALLIAGVAAMLVALRHPAPGAADARMAWLATARQFGPVGYRDPPGAISPDGKSIAYAEGRFLRVLPVGGGPIADLPPQEAQIRNLSWHPDSRTIVVDGYHGAFGWAIYDVAARSRRPLWDGRRAPAAEIDGKPVSAAVEDLRQAAWSPDGRAIAAIVNGREGQELWIVDAGRRVRARLAAGHPHRVAGMDAGWPGRLHQHNRRKIAHHDSLRRRRSRRQPGYRCLRSVGVRAGRTHRVRRCAQCVWHARPVGDSRTRRERAAPDVVLARHLRAERRRRRHGRVQDPELPHDRRRLVGGGRTCDTAHHVPE